MNVFLDRQGFALYHKKITEYIDKKDSEIMDSAGKVNDVIVNGKTIVVDKIANIDNSITAEYIIGRIGIAPVGRAKADKDGNAIDETYATIDSLKQVEAIAIGRSKSIGAENLVKFQEFLNNNYGSIEFKFGDNIFIVALDEPDLWCYGTNDITENQSLTKEQMIEALNTTEGLKLKGYTFHKLETQKVDLSNYVEKEEGKGLSKNDFTDELKSAYDEHISSDHASADAEKNQNAFGSVAIDGQPTVNADSPTSTLTIKAGERVSLTSDSDGRTVTINASADDIKIKSIESSGATITITFMDESSIGFELDTSETDLVDPDDIIVGKAKDANLLGGRDGSHYLDYNNHANAPIVNANLSDFIEPVAGTYYKNVGLTDDTFVNGVIYYYDGEAYHSTATSIPLAEKGQPNGVAELNENGIVPASQLPIIPTTTSQLINDSDFVSNSSVDEKIANLVGASKEELDTLEELGEALENHKDAYGALLEVVGNKAENNYNSLPNRPIVNANLIGTSNPVAGTYYRHVGATNGTYTRGVIYYYDGNDYQPIPNRNQGDKIEVLQDAELNLASTTPEIGVINEAGIHVRIPEIEIETQDGRYITLAGRDTVPITAGDGIEFTKNDNNTIAINANTKPIENRIDELEEVLQDILEIIQGGTLTPIKVGQIEELIVSYFENKTVEEVEAE